MSSPWYIYIIKTGQNTLYTGVTTDVERRFKEHQTGKSKGAKYLKGKPPLVLVWHEAVSNKKLAMQLEYRIKRLSREMKDKLVAGVVCTEGTFPELFAQVGVNTAFGLKGEAND